MNPGNPAPNGATITYASVPTVNSVTLSRNESRRPRVSAIKPVGTSNSAQAAVKIAFVMKTCRSDSPDSSRNIVLMPQMSDAESV